MFLVPEVVGKKNMKDYNPYNFDLQKSMSVCIQAVRKILFGAQFFMCCRISVFEEIELQLLYRWVPVEKEL